MVAEADSAHATIYKKPGAQLAKHAFDLAAS